MAIRICKVLQSMLAGVFCCKCVVLLDEYDTPLFDIRGKTWESNAQLHHLNIINFIFKDNSLCAGVLVGVCYIQLSNLSSGINNIDYLLLAVMEKYNRIYREVSDLNYFGDLFAFAKSDIEVLVNKLHEQYPATRRYSTAAIFDKAVEWYSGYRFGMHGGKFNPHNVLMFLQSLCATSLDDAVCNYWEMTGNPHMIGTIILNNRMDILALATELLHKQHDNSSGVLKLAGVWKQPSSWDSKWPIIKVSLDQKYKVNATKTMGKLAQLSSELYAGNIEGLLTETRELKRRDGAECKQYFDLLSELQSGIDMPDLIITFPATKRLSDQLVAIIRLKQIYGSKSADCLLECAKEGPEQISDTKYASLQKDSTRRLDIAIAMGCEEVAMHQHLWETTKQNYKNQINLT
ncbi:hypothetical protein BX667DRAFT_539519 [Coemansia mojavensis]|nr:hypothetical protein BX667DRAFT_539519 [Coemansia mojavensis]